MLHHLGLGGIRNRFADEALVGGSKDDLVRRCQPLGVPPVAHRQNISGGIPAVVATRQCCVHS